MAAKVPFPSKCTLFEGITEPEFQKLFGCLHGRYILLDKGDCLFREEDVVDKVGVVVSGRINTCRDRLDGKTNLIETVEADGTFGALYAWTNRKVPGVRIVASCKTEVLLFSASAFPMMCQHGCKCHVQLIRNALRILSTRNFSLMRRIRLLSERTTAQKVMLYLHIRAKMAKSREFDIPLDRQQLADYLCCERSALSAVLSDLKKRKKIDFHKNHFVLPK